MDENQGYRNSSWSRQRGGVRGGANEDNNRDRGEDQRRRDDNYRPEHHYNFPLESSFTAPAMGMPETAVDAAQDVFSHDQQSYRHEHAPRAAASATEEYQRYHHHHHDPRSQQYVDDVTEGQLALPPPENYNPDPVGYDQHYHPQANYGAANQSQADWRPYPDMPPSFQQQGDGRYDYSRQGGAFGGADPAPQYHQPYHDDIHRQQSFSGAPPMAMPSNSASSSTYAAASYEQEQQYYYAQQQQQQQEMHMRMMHEQQHQHYYGQGMHWSQAGPWYNHPHDAAAMQYHPHAPHYAAYGGTYGGGSRSSGVVGSSTSGLHDRAGYTRSDSQTESVGSKRSRRPKREKDKDKPKRPLSAYNLFFKDERAKMLAELGIDSSSSNKDSTEGGDADNDDGSELDSSEHKKRKTESGGARGKKTKGVGFAPMAKQIAAKWKNIDEETLEKYKELAEEDMRRYRKEMDAYRKKQGEGSGPTRELGDTVSEDTKERHSSTKDEKDDNKG